VDKLLSILRACGTSIEEGAIALTIGFLIFSVMERLYGFSPAKKTVRANLLDLQYAFISMLYPPFIYFLISGFFALRAIHYSDSSHNPDITPLTFAGEVLILLVVRDCLIYLRHRIFHLPKVWAFHSIHHSSEEVNWISAARFHPAENIIEASGEIVLFIVATLIGFDAWVLSAAGLLIGFYNFFIHSNLRWTFGPLRYVLVSPVFHRWHHSDLPEAMDKNFAAMFSCLDLAFGTFYMPEGILPHTVGLSSEEKTTHPRSLAGQLLYPFKKR